MPVMLWELLDGLQFVIGSGAGPAGARSHMGGW